MRLVFLIILSLSTLFAQKVLVINSNSNINKYFEAQKAFSENFEQEFKTIDISNMSIKDIKEYLYDEYPDMVYTIGSKAYQYANRFIPEKKIFFSSIVNYRRFKMDENRYGVSNEVHSGMKITLIKTMFPKIKRVGILYSSYTKDIFREYKQIGKQIGIDIVGQNISDKYSFESDIDGYILISDPLLIKDENRLKTLFNKAKENKTPIFAYHELFINYGAILSISVDNPTVGRQIASMIKQKSSIKSEKIQKPMGTKLVLNKKVLDQYGIEYNNSILSIINKVVEWV